MAEPAGKKKSGGKKSTVYKIEGASISRLKKMCPRCGSGNFLAEHANRFHCGRCKYTNFKKQEPAVQPAAAPQADAPKTP